MIHCERLYLKVFVESALCLFNHRWREYVHEKNPNKLPTSNNDITRDILVGLQEALSHLDADAKRQMLQAQRRRSMVQDMRERINRLLENMESP